MSENPIVIKLEIEPSGDFNQDLDNAAEFLEAMARGIRQALFERQNREAQETAERLLAEHGARWDAIDRAELLNAGFVDVGRLAEEYDWSVREEALWDQDIASLEKE